MLSYPLQDLVPKAPNENKPEQLLCHHTLWQFEKETH